jgi:hypothetical protein
MGASAEDETERSAFRRLVRRESSTIQGENLGDAEIVCKRYQCRVREIHWRVSVLLHQVRGGHHLRRLGRLFDAGETCHAKYMKKTQ